MRLVFLALAALVTLAGCAADTRYSSQDAVLNAAYQAPGGPSLTVFTMISNDTGSGGHSGLLINGSQRVLFDPAGSWYHPAVPEQNDVHFGMTEFMLDFYVDFHARETYYVVMQEIPLTLEQADAMIASARAQGAAPKAYCTQYNTAVLKRVPGFENIRKTWFPVNLMEQIAKLPNVTTRKIYDDDPDYNKAMLQAGIVPVPRAEFTGRVFVE